MTAPQAARPPRPAGEPGRSQAAEAQPPVPMRELLRRSARLLQDRRLAGPFLAIWLGPRLALAGLTAWVFGFDVGVLLPGWGALLAADLLLISPVTALATARLSLRVWDHGPVGLEPLGYAVRHYGRALGLYLAWFVQALAVITGLMLLSLPGLALGGLLTRLVFWGAAGLKLAAFLAVWAALGLATLWLWRRLLGGRLLRVFTLFYPVAAFRHLEGRLGSPEPGEGPYLPWLIRRRLPRLERALAADRLRPSLFLVLAIVVGLYALDCGFVLFKSELPAWLFAGRAAVEGLLIAFKGAVLWWLTAAAAGFYRLNLQHHDHEH